MTARVELIDPAHATGERAKFFEATEQFRGRSHGSRTGDGSQRTNPAPTAVCAPR